MICSLIFDGIFQTNQTTSDFFKYNNYKLASLHTWTLVCFYTHFSIYEPYQIQIIKFGGALCMNLSVLLLIPKAYFKGWLSFFFDFICLGWFLRTKGKNWNSTPTHSNKSFQPQVWEKRRNQQEKSSTGFLMIWEFTRVMCTDTPQLKQTLYLGFTK